MDSSYRPPTYGPWPYNAGVHHPHPSEFHCCCNHTYPPDYYSFRPPLPQELPPPHLYYHGPFPQHSNACPSYFVPPHPYHVDQMPYGYDKLKSHCCGYTNHVCHGAEKSNVKIEEERLDAKHESEHKDADRGSIIRHPNNQYPFIWLPPGNMEGKENGKRYELSPQLLNGWAPMGRKMTGDVKQQEQDNQLLNGSAPVSSKRTGDVMRQEQNNQKEKQFHWPIVWMPAGYDEPKQKAKEIKKMEDAPNNSEEAPRSPKIKIIPVSWFENGHHDQKPASRDGSGDQGDRSAVKSQPAVTEHRDGMTLEGSPKTTPALPKRVNDERKHGRENYKTISVVPENEIDEKKASTYRTIPVMKESDEKKTGMSEKKEAKKTSNAEKVEENGKTKHSESATAKHSKLPPVCLRVDPFPRKKSGNGSSRSPSPPTRKHGDKAKKDMKEAQGQNLEPKQSDTGHMTLSEVKEKSPDETQKRMGFSNESVQAASVERSREEVPTSKHDQKVQAGSTVIGTQENAGAKSSQGGAVQENAGAEIFKGCDKSKNEDETVIESEAAKDDVRTCRANLSEPDAAVHIQSAYRGYDVRRWQPLDKLRKIRNVHEQMQGVKKQLQCLEDSCKKPTEKEQVAIGETIMNLLLILDTIQGLHPSIREARKSVARELVCLQEKLDTLCKQPSGEFDHTNSDEEKSERAENIIQTVAPTVTTEASEKEERAVEEPSVDSMEPCDAVPSGIPMEVKQDEDACEQKNEKEEESCSTTIEGANKEGKAAEQFELQASSSMDMLSDAALPENPVDNQEHEIKESNAVSVEQVTECCCCQQEKPAVEGEGKEEPLLNSTEPLHDAASAGDSSGLKQCTASADQSLHAESNTGLSSDSTEDINSSVESGVATEKDGPVDGQVHGTAAGESLELKHDVSPAEEDQQRELRGPVHLEDSSVSLQDEAQHDLIPADDSVMSNTKDQPEQTAVDESDDAVQCAVSGKDEPPHEDQKTEEATVDKLTGGSANYRDSLLGASRKEPDIQESHPNLAEEADDPRGEIVFPELDSCELSCAHEGGITGHERSETEVSSESQSDAQKEHADVVVSETDECTETLKEAPVDASTANPAEDVGVQVFVTENCTEMPEDAQMGVSGANSAEDVAVQVSVTEKCTEDAPVRAVGANPAEEEVDTLKEDIAVQTENKASQEALSAAATPDDGLKDSGEKNLAEENQQLKELLQKLLASGNDQMGVITDLSEKVKALERKLARKKRPKVVLFMVDAVTGANSKKAPSGTQYHFHYMPMTKDASRILPQNASCHGVHCEVTGSGSQCTFAWPGIGVQAVASKPLDHLQCLRKVHHPTCKMAAQVKAKGTATQHHATLNNSAFSSPNFPERKESCFNLPSKPTKSWALALILFISSWQAGRSITEES
ncbi:BAG family molecular chaperone regulator 6 [Dichanthelium oligosanthes]|uniref:BAG family molecular chaperone regulator 6 n=1 Tax=Dichanthelium oligosanthes TaxID=888268 RepID=A0A1E5WBF9_9POAL|nr:BAG family molecular chaperone regulator 6 [Dichanthelium oligosanthes]